MYSIFVYLYICCYFSHTPDGVLRIKKFQSFKVSVTLNYIKKLPVNLHSDCSNRNIAGQIIA